MAVSCCKQAIVVPKYGSIKPMDDPKPQSTPTTARRCFSGALICSGFAALLYQLTAAIATTFANKPLPTGNNTATNIAVLVRTLVVGASALGTFVFAFVTLGLVALGIQILVRGKPSQS